MTSVVVYSIINGKKKKTDWYVESSKLIILIARPEIFFSFFVVFIVGWKEQHDYVIFPPPYSSISVLFKERLCVRKWKRGFAEGVVKMTLMIHNSRACLITVGKMYISKIETSNFLSIFCLARRVQGCICVSMIVLKWKGLLIWDITDLVSDCRDWFRFSVIENRVPDAKQIHQKR